MITDVKTIVIKIGGEPVHEPRQRAEPVWSKKKGKYVARTFTPDVRYKTNGVKGPDQLAPWKAQIEVASFGKVREPWTGPVRVDITWYFSRPQYLMKPKAHDGVIPYTAKPDRDNLDKAVLDALKNGGLFRDDAQVYCGMLAKFYVARGMSPGARIEITLQAIGDGAEQLRLEATP